MLNLDANIHILKNVSCDNAIDQNTAIVFCFEPEEDCAAFAVRAIDCAEHKPARRVIVRRVEDNA
jgi:hypothetical protein